MKILTATWAIYDERIKEFENVRTGGGLIIKNLCEELGKHIDSYLIVWRDDLPQMDLGNIHIVKNYIHSKANICEDREKRIADRIEIRKAAFKKALEEINPDLVSFQGMSEISNVCMKICDDNNIKYFYTEHLFIKRDKKFEGNTKVLQWEKLLYSKVGINIVAISSGMKSCILHDFPQIPQSRITVIPNGTDFKAVKYDSDIMIKYRLSGKKVLICAGSICKRKNQIAVVDAYGLIDPQIREKIAIIFLGNDRLHGMLEEAICQHGYDNNLICAGAVSSEEMKKYYSIANGLIMPSFAEGLSIAALEMLAYGQPIIMFSDSECVDDLNDANICVLANKRTNADLARAIEEWYFREWDTEYIKNYSQYFSMERVTKDYLEYFEKVI